MRKATCALELKLAKINLLWLILERKNCGLKHTPTKMAAIKKTSKWLWKEKKTKRLATARAAEGVEQLEHTCLACGTANWFNFGKPSCCLYLKLNLCHPSTQQMHSWTHPTWHVLEHSLQL